MFGQDAPERFANVPSDRGGAGGWRLLMLILAGIGAFLFWASTHEIEEVTRGVGRVVPSSETKRVQTLDGGRVVSVAVAEGDFVEAGAPLMVIDPTRAEAEQGELLEREAALLTEQVRLTAEAEGRDPVFPEELRARAPAAVAAETAVHVSRVRQLETELTVLEGQRAQRQAELVETRARLAQLDAMLEPLTDEVSLSESLFERGALPQIDLLRLRSRLADTTGQRGMVEASLPRIEAAIAQAEAQLSATRSAFRLGAAERLARLQVELAVVREGLRAATDRVTETELRAPVAGYVNELVAPTPGTVLQPGAIVAEIVPTGEDLWIEAEIAPSDVAFIAVGDSVSVKISAYDYLVYGTLEGEVLRVGANTVEGLAGEPVFRVIVEATGGFGRSDRALPILPGMQATVDIRTGTNRVLAYLARPLLRVQAEALRER
jgi:adhesin transport system membrane fusion protein